MQTIGIDTLKEQLSECLEAVAAGETVRVTDGGRVVAEIVPPQGAAQTAPATPPSAALTPEEKWAELIRKGIVRPAKRPLGARLPPQREPVMTFEELMAEIAADREDR